MYKLLIADDEPLVCVGIQSTLDWEKFDIEVVGTARNGQMAADMIRELSPDIVITDIKMPLKTGLEVAREVREAGQELPVFIILTSYEEFGYVREAMRYQAVDYLVKLELDENALAQAVRKAVALVHNQRQNEEIEQAAGQNSLPALREKFFIRLFNNLFDSEEQYTRQKEDLGLVFDAPAYVVATCELVSENEEQKSRADLLHLYSSAIQMARDTLTRYSQSYVATLDARHFAVVFALEQQPEQGGWQTTVEQALTKTADILSGYFSLRMYAAVGSVVQDPRYLGGSYHSGRWCFHATGPQQPIVFSDENGAVRPGADPSVLHETRTGIRRAFEELDTDALYAALTTVAEELAKRPDLHVQAMDAACNILYMAISLLPKGEDTIEEIFSDETEGYRGIYRLRTVEEINQWLCKLRDGCCEMLRTQRRSYKMQVVHSVQTYIRDNLDKHLSLNEVAAVFNFSPSYLSQLFAKYAGEGFVEYITGARISAAREMMARGEGKVYEIAEKLGFESSFYFSKVFKKVTGVSPREYMQRLENAAAPPAAKRRAEDEPEGSD